MPKYFTNTKGVEKNFLRVVPRGELTNDGKGGPLCVFNRIHVQGSDFVLKSHDLKYLGLTSGVLGTVSSRDSAVIMREYHLGKENGGFHLEVPGSGFLHCGDRKVFVGPLEGASTFFSPAGDAKKSKSNLAGGSSSVISQKVDRRETATPPPLSFPLLQAASVCLHYGSNGHSLNVMGDKSRVSGHGRGGPFATFRLHPTSLSTPSPSYFLQSYNGLYLSLAGGEVTTSEGMDTPLISHMTHGGGTLLEVSNTGLFLSVGAAPNLAVSLSNKEAATSFLIKQSKLEWSEAAERAAKVLSTKAMAATLPLIPKPAAFFPPADFFSSFVRDGYVLIPGGIGQLAVEAALRVINASLAEDLVSASANGTPRKPTHSDHIAITGLYSNTSIVGAVGALLGAESTPSSMKQAQVATRFPKPLSIAQSLSVFASPATPSPTLSLSSYLKEDQKGGRWHIDGMDKNRPYPFSLLVACFLSTTLEDGSGQFTVFPGSHVYLSQLLKSKGEGVLYGEGVEKPQLPDQYCPLELKVRAGDVCLAHPLLAHRVGINYSPFPRYAAFFRVSAKGHETARENLAMEGDLFAEYKGIPQSTIPC